MILEREREAVARYGRRLLEAGLTTGAGGNLSVACRQEDRVAISPSGMPYGEIGPEDVPVLDGKGRIVEGRRRPSTEWHFHLALYRARPEVGAVVHTHSTYATTFACLEREIPPVHYLIGFAGRRVPVAPYATFGTEDLARCVVAAMEPEVNAVLLAHHGVVAVGADLAAAFTVAESVEFVARIGFQAEAIGSPRPLPADEMERVRRKFRDYGRPPPGGGI
jgi:L-fuculose-phosphate aldolase